MDRKTKQALTARLKNAVVVGDFVLDGVDFETSFSNGKTAAFVEKVGIDAALEMLEAMLTYENYSEFSPARGWYEEDAHVYRDYSGVSREYRNNGYDIVNDLYVKAFKFGEGQTPWFVIHD